MRAVDGYLHCNCLSAPGDAAAMRYDFSAHAMGADAQAGAGAAHILEGRPLQGHVSPRQRHHRATLKGHPCERWSAVRAMAHNLSTCITKKHSQHLQEPTTACTTNTHDA